MKLSKVILLSTVCSFCNAADCSYAAYNTSESLSLISTSGIHTYHTQHLTDETPFLLSARFANQWCHLRTHSQSDATRPRDTGGNIESLFNLDVRIKSEHDIRVASVCFITDTGACSGEKFSNDETPGSGGSGNPTSPTPGEFCQKAGYTNTPCPSGMVPDKYCPVDSSYHSGCKCPDTYNKTCDAAAGLKPVNASDTCGGKYKECCNICSDYTYTSVPSGYVKAGECQSCNGVKYKVKCDTSLYPQTSGVCGSYGGSGGSCSDDSGAHYKQCNCPNNYEWNAGQKKCVCATSFKYACNGTGYAGGDGNACDNQYSKCKCASGYTWNAASGSCVCSGTDWCTINQNCGALGYAKQTCSGAAVKCPFDTSYSYCL